MAQILFKSLKLSVYFVSLVFSPLAYFYCKDGVIQELNRNKIRLLLFFFLHPGFLFCITNKISFAD